MQRFPARGWMTRAHDGLCITDRFSTGYGAPSDAGLVPFVVAVDCYESVKTLVNILA